VCARSRREGGKRGKKREEGPNRLALVQRQRRTLERGRKEGGRKKRGDNGILRMSHRAGGGKEGGEAARFSDSRKVKRGKKRRRGTLSSFALNQEMFPRARRKGRGGEGGARPSRCREVVFPCQEKKRGTDIVCGAKRGPISTSIYRTDPEHVDCGQQREEKKKGKKRKSMEEYHLLCAPQPRAEKKRKEERKRISALFQ